MIVTRAWCNNLVVVISQHWFPFADYLPLFITLMVLLIRRKSKFSIKKLYSFYWKFHALLGFLYFQYCSTIQTVIRKLHQSEGYNKEKRNKFMSKTNSLKEVLLSLSKILLSLNEEIVKMTYTGTTISFISFQRFGCSVKTFF